METLNLDFQVRGRSKANNTSQENNNYYKNLTVTTVPTKKHFFFKTLILPIQLFLERNIDLVFQKQS